MFSGAQEKAVVDWKRKYDYGVSRTEVEAFIAENPCVRQFLWKYAESQSTFCACSVSGICYNKPRIPKATDIDLDASSGTVHRALNALTFVLSL